MSEVCLVFIGSPLLDIYAERDETLLKKFGLQKDGCLRADEGHDLLFRDLFLSPDSHLSAGGSALNAARIAKWAMRPKGQVAFIGCVGCDEYGEWLRDQLMSEDVIPLFVKEPKAKTGVCACLTFDGMRSMCTRHGASAKFSKEHLYLEHIYSKVKTAHCIFIVGYFVGHSPDVVLDLAENCSPSQVFSLSLSAEYICREYSEALTKVMPRVDVLFGNEVEVKAFATALCGDRNIEVEEAIRVIKQLPRSRTLQPRIIIVTRGSEPVFVDDGNDNLRVFDVPKDVPVVDSVGCGDALAGAFLASYVVNRGIDSSVKVGIDAAAKIAQVHGCNPLAI
ncbi:adenosine kinase-like isoform X2 [Argiope bruennichi]|uniref:Adenosine kinase n=1 Tax=Argiope bruennichi TaxID=94029 RepID=A0A8T0E1C9_ARGBR|nr:adenosine kinase-like isoform X2 [Argiope bruennichi]KAF8764532.1 Adenosine kinase like protein [Argiope bruennichi]